MALETVTLTWNLTDLIQDGISAVLTIYPVALANDSADVITITQIPQQVAFSGGAGSLPGIVASDNSALDPPGVPYRILVDTQGTALIPGQRVLQMTAAINHADGASQDLSSLVPLQSVPAFAAFLPLLYPPGAGDRLAWTSDADGNGSWQVPVPPAADLTDATVITVDAAAASDFYLTLTEDSELGNPSGTRDGQRLLFWVTQGTGGGFTLSYGTDYEFTAGLPAQPLATAPGDVNLLGFIWNADRGKAVFAAFL